MKKYSYLLGLTLATASLLIAPVSAEDTDGITPAKDKTNQNTAPEVTAQSLDDLLKRIKEVAKRDSQVNKEREKRFLEQRNQRKNLLAEAKQQLAEEKKRSQKLEAQFDVNEKKLTEATELLRQRAGSLGEIMGVVKQVAGDTSAVFENSVISAQFGKRKHVLTDLAKRKALPSIAQLESLWFELQREMTESGKVSVYQGNIVATNGEKHDAPIIRVGSFNAISNGRFLNYNPETGSLVELVRQPASRYTSIAEDFTSNQDKFADMIVDPSRGSILSVVVQSPELSERIAQGKLVGYLILCVMLIGFAIAAERFFVLSRIERAIKREKQSEQHSDKNPLGRVIAVYMENKSLALEALERKIDEAIIKELPVLQRGLPIIKILAVIAPLMGLLGTVTGMIETFQSITLFGTGDPKLMAGGISQALVTTVLGLIAAIPLIVVHAVVSGKSKRCRHVLEEQSAGIVAEHAENQHKLEA